MTIRNVVQIVLLALFAWAILVSFIQGITRGGLDFLLLFALILALISWAFPSKPR